MDRVCVVLTSPVISGGVLGPALVSSERRPFFSLSRRFTATSSSWTCRVTALTSSYFCRFCELNVDLFVAVITFHVTLGLS